ncbi:unnamed protein product, partial [Brachionus calyciflorus]
MALKQSKRKNNLTTSLSTYSIDNDLQPKSKPKEAETIETKTKQSQIKSNGKFFAQKIVEETNDEEKSINMTSQENDHKSNSIVNYTSQKNNVIILENFNDEDETESEDENEIVDCDVKKKLITIAELGLNNKNNYIRGVITYISNTGYNEKTCIFTIILQDQSTNVLLQFIDLDEIYFEYNMHDYIEIHEPVVRKSNLLDQTFSTNEFKIIVLADNYSKINKIKQVENLCNVPTRKKNSTEKFDILAIVTAVDEQITLRIPKKMFEIVILDKSKYKAKITFWNKFAEIVKQEVRPENVIAIKNANIKIFNDKKFISLSLNSYFEINPICDATNNLKECKDSHKKKNFTINQENPSVENIILDEYGHLFQQYKTNLALKLRMSACDICSQLFPENTIVKIDENSSIKLNDEILQSVLKTENLSYPLKICSLYCIKDLKNNRVPKFSVLNNMKLYDPPECLKKLNFFEQLLIKQGSSFQTISKLENLCNKKRDPQKLFKAIKGLTIFLPLETNETINHIKHTLPCFDNLNILVDTLPNDKSQIFSYLIDLKDVEIALKWLQENNPLYSKIKIDVSKKLIETENILFDYSSKKTTITHKEIKNSFENFTTANTVLNVPFINEIEQYKSQRIESIPFKDKEKQRDTKCFPVIFSRGIGGMYDDRKIKIHPAMYCRWILKQKIPIARRDIQYTFSLSNIKDVNSINYGIYALLNTKNYKNKNVKNVMEDLNSNNTTLESNLEVLLKSVRGSREYWRNICYNLEAMDEKFGPATFFLTLSCAEYYWKDLKQFLVERNSDLENISELDSNKLCSQDP